MVCNGCEGDGYIGFAPPREYLGFINGIIFPLVALVVLASDY